VQELLINGKIKIPDNKQQEFINGFNKLLQDISGQFQGILQQVYQYEYAEIIEEIKENV
jgi:hypothetical protein